jgi:hypothetical protein
MRSPPLPFPAGPETYSDNGLTNLLIDPVPSILIHLGQTILDQGNRDSLGGIRLHTTTHQGGNLIDLCHTATRMPPQPRFTIS